MPAGKICTDCSTGALCAANFGLDISADTLPARQRDRQQRRRGEKSFQSSNHNTPEPKRPNRRSQRLCRATTETHSFRSSEVIGEFLMRLLSTGIPRGWPIATFARRLHWFAIHPHSVRRCCRWLGAGAATRTGSLFREIGMVISRACKCSDGSPKRGPLP